MHRMLTIPAKVELAPGVEARGGACKRTEIAASGAAGESSATARLRASNNLVLIPTYQEAKTIGPLIDAILSLPVRMDILVIDDGSTDGTRAGVEDRSANHPRVGMIADVAVGSRFARGGRLDYRGWRLFVSRAANGLARRLLPF